MYCAEITGLGAYGSSKERYSEKSLKKIKEKNTALATQCLVKLESTTFGRLPRDSLLINCKFKYLVHYM